MSIVQEALKKAETEQILKPAQARGNRSFGPPALLAVFVILLVVVVRLFSMPAKTGEAKAIPAAAEAIYKPMSAVNMKSGDSPVVEPYSPPDANSRTGKGKFPDFVLNGIMELVDGPRAIINNVIVGTGDVIDGAKVKKIDKDKVLLQKKEGSVVSLGME